MTNDHACRDCTHDHGGGFSTGVVVGAVLGAVAAYIVSSPDGKEKAKKLLDESKKALKELEKHAPGAMEKAKDVKDKVAEKVSESIDKAQEIQEDAETFSSRFKKRFFRKKGKSLSSLW